MRTTCKYCNEPENKQENPGLICESCICFVHLACTRRTGTPGDFACDVFFDFTCEDCSPDNKEQFKRNKFPWVSVIILTLHHLSKHSLGISNHGFFHYKTHICSFVDRNWNLLFGSHCKQKKNWIGTIAGALSVYNNLLFRSGSVALGETGWWKLLHKFSPAVAAHIVQELGRDKNKSRVRSHMALDKTLFIYKIIEMGYKSYISQDVDMSMPINEPPAKRKRLESSSLSALSSSSFFMDSLESDNRGELLDDSMFEDAGVGSLPDADHVRVTTYTHMPSDSSSIHSFQQSIMFEDSDTRSVSPLPPTEQSDTELKKPESKPKKLPEKPRRETLFSSQLNSVDLPWLENANEKKEDLVEMTQYQEIQLLKQVEGMILKVGDPKKKAELYRLKAKLALRRLKRHKHLPLFDLDKTVKLLAGYVTEDPNAGNNTERVLDRFQRTYLLDNLCGTISRPHWGPHLVAGPATAFRSPYSGATLKPYIRRDASSEPLWVTVTQELLVKTHRHIPGYRPPAPASLDYSYVRPHHVAAVNALCAQFFWPGVDLTEALQYPEYSCVVTYKRIVVACAFLVPDVGPNQAYISFVVTRPEWRNAKIATFMLYHLLQTCTGKDVTLHVSPANPAIFLYQKFGFKVEELVQDFYEKYYDIDYKGCRHALFLRLVR